MNPITFNNGLDLPWDLGIMMEGEDAPFIIPSHVTESPIFIWDDNPNKVEDADGKSPMDEFQAKVNVEPNLLPFKTMRLFVKFDHKTCQLGIRGLRVWMHHENGIFLWCAILKTAFMEDLVATAVFTKEDNASVCRVGKQDIDMDDPEYKNIEPLILAIFTSICWFIREVNLPSNFIAKVAPENKVGKSVEWVRARSHYVLLHKAHPANNKDVKTGSVVAPSALSLKRQAHTRRAHARILRSSRFRHKMGLTIKIKACWVGPDEWKQSGSIYKMTDLSASRRST